MIRSRFDDPDDPDDPDVYEGPDFDDYTSADLDYFADVAADRYERAFYGD